MNSRKTIDQIRAERERAKSRDNEPTFVSGEILPPGSPDGYRARTPAPYKMSTPEMRRKWFTGRPDYDHYAEQVTKADRAGQALVGLKKTQTELIKADGECEAEWQKTETVYGSRQFVPLEVKRVGDNVRHRLTLRKRFPLALCGTA